MATSLEQLARDIRGFENRREVLRQLRKEIREPLPRVRKNIKARALATLPKRGGLNAWAAAIRITLQIKTSGRTAGVRVRGGRNSLRKRSDMRALDRGRVRHPSWGRRGAGQWHTQTVEPGFVTNPVTETTEWRDVCLRAVDNAVRSIGRG